MPVEPIYDDICSLEDYTLCVRFYEVSQVGDGFIPELVREERIVGMPYGLCRMADVESVTAETDGGAFSVLFRKDLTPVCLADGQDFVTTNPVTIRKYLKGN